MVARIGGFPPLSPRPGSKREIYERYRNGVNGSARRAEEAKSDIELVDALSSLDFFLDKLHEELKGAK